MIMLGHEYELTDDNTYHQNKLSNNFRSNSLLLRLKTRLNSFFVSDRDLVPDDRDKDNESIM
jgi:hypothetical protein